MGALPKRAAISILVPTGLCCLASDGDADLSTNTTAHLIGDIERLADCACGMSSWTGGRSETSGEMVGADGVPGIEVQAVGGQPAGADAGVEMRLVAAQALSFGVNPPE